MRSDMTLGRCPRFIRWGGWLGMMLVLFLWVGVVRAADSKADPEARFDAANRLYEAGRYAEAIQAYESMRGEGLVSSALLFNLGNARFKLGQVGQAIVAYRRAQEWAPRDPDLAANLRFAREQNDGVRVPRPVWIPSGLERIGLGEWAVLSVVFLWGWLLLQAVGFVRPPWRLVLRSYSWALAALWLMSFASFGGVWYLQRGLKWMVVVRPETVARLGPLAESQSAFTLKDGAEAIVRDRKGDWVQVVDGRQRVGWVAGNDLVAVHP